MIVEEADLKWYLFCLLVAHCIFMSHHYYIYYFTFNRAFEFFGLSSRLWAHIPVRIIAMIFKDIAPNENKQNTMNDPFLLYI